MLPIDEILSRPSSDRGLDVIGTSRAGRPLRGLAVGEGATVVSLIAGCHADEPVGPWMLGHLAHYLTSLPESSRWRREVRWLVVPHVNPDGAEANRGWAERTLDTIDHLGAEDRGFALEAYLSRVERELPGADLEFGFPHDATDCDARPEARAVASFLAPHAPFDLHITFHGMGFAQGPWFLVEPMWVARSAGLRQRLRHRVGAMGYRLHEVDRGGEKGFWRIAEGFTTRPDSRAMRDHFLALGDADTASGFRPSSMEYVRSLGGDPLTLVSEMPLFLLPEAGPLADPTLSRSERLARLTAQPGGVRAMPIRDQMRLQLELLDAGLEAVMAHPARVSSPPTLRSPG